MNFISFGRRFSIFIWPAPLLAEPLAPGLPRRRFSIAMAPVASRLMSNRPSLVSFVTSPADMQQTMASHASRRAASAGMTARM